MGATPYLLVLGQDCAARYQLLNCLLGERRLPLGPDAGEPCEGVQGNVCKRRKLCFTHGRQTRLSLALPGQYELVHQLAANCGRWDTVPRVDLEIQDECEDPAHRLAELEITLHHPLLQVGSQWLALHLEPSACLQHSCALEVECFFCFFFQSDHLVQVCSGMRSCRFLSQQSFSNAICEVHRRRMSVFSRRERLRLNFANYL